MMEEGCHPPGLPRIEAGGKLEEWQDWPGWSNFAPPPLLPRASELGKGEGYEPKEWPGWDVAWSHDRAQEWMVAENPSDLCTLRGSPAVDEQQSSEHCSKSFQCLECSGSESTASTDPGSRPPAVWGDPSHFEWRDSWWFCKVCSKWADGQHVKSQKHTKRVYWADHPGTWSGPHGRPPWLLTKDGFDFCSLCGSFAVDSHLNSERHRKRLEWYEWCNDKELQLPEDLSEEECWPEAVRELSRGDEDSAAASTSASSDPWGPSWEAAVRECGSTIAAAPRVSPSVAAAAHQPASHWRSAPAEECESR